MVEPLAAAHGTVTSRSTVLVRVTTDVGEGWGECVALNEPTYMTEWSNGEWLVLRDLMIPRLLQHQEPIEAGDVVPMFSVYKGHHPAKAALEMALLDAELKAAQLSLTRYLGGTSRAVQVCVVVGLLSGDNLLRAIDSQLECGYRHLKIKIAPGFDVERVDMIRREFPELPLRVDGNGSYDWSNTDHQSRLRALDDRELVMMEQPLPPGRAGCYVKMREVIKTPISLDESISSYVRGLNALEMELCDVMTIKPGLVGGYLTARKLHDSCQQRGVPTALGGMIEAGLARAANLAVAALPGFVQYPAEIAPDGRWFPVCINRAPVELVDGSIAVPDQPGIGCDVDLEVVHGLTVDLHVARASRGSSLTD